MQALTEFGIGVCGALHLMRNWDFSFVPWVTNAQVAQIRQICSRCHVRDLCLEWNKLGPRYLTAMYPKLAGVIQICLFAGKNSLMEIFGALQFEMEQTGTDLTSFATDTDFVMRKRNKFLSQCSITGICLVARAFMIGKQAGLSHQYVCFLICAADLDAIPVRALRDQVYAIACFLTKFPDDWASGLAFRLLTVRTGEVSRQQELFFLLESETKNPAFYKFRSNIKKWDSLGIVSQLANLANLTCSLERAHLDIAYVDTLVRDDPPPPRCNSFHCRSGWEWDEEEHKAYLRNLIAAGQFRIDPESEWINPDQWKWSVWESSIKSWLKSAHVGLSEIQNAWVDMLQFPKARIYKRLVFALRNHRAQQKALRDAILFNKVYFCKEAQEAAPMRDSEQAREAEQSVNVPQVIQVEQVREAEQSVDVPQVIQVEQVREVEQVVDVPQVIEEEQVEQVREAEQVVKVDQVEQLRDSETLLKIDQVEQLRDSETLLKIDQVVKVEQVEHLREAKQVVVVPDSEPLIKVEQVVKVEQVGDLQKQVKAERALKRKNAKKAKRAEVAAQRAKIESMCSLQSQWYKLFTIAQTKARIRKDFIGKCRHRMECSRKLRSAMALHRATIFGCFKLFTFCFDKIDDIVRLPTSKHSHKTRATCALEFMFQLEFVCVPTYFGMIYQSDCGKVVETTDVLATICDYCDNSIEELLSTNNNMTDLIAERCLVLLKSTFPQKLLRYLNQNLKNCVSLLDLVQLLKINLAAYYDLLISNRALFTRSLNFIYSDCAEFPASDISGWVKTCRAANIWELLHKPIKSGTLICWIYGIVTLPLFEILGLEKDADFHKQVLF
jgi:hypothetical protein